MTDPVILRPLNRRASFLVQNASLTRKPTKNYPAAAVSRTRVPGSVNDKRQHP